MNPLIRQLWTALRRPRQDPAWCGVLTLLALLTAPLPAPAAPYDNRPKILLHVRPTTTREACQWGDLADCRQVETSAGLSTPDGPFYFVYLLAARGRMEGIYRMRCGITYQDGGRGDISDRRGIDILEWRLCAPVQFGTPGGNLWPQANSGSEIYWDRGGGCQRGDVAVAGYFYVAAYDPDTLRVIEDPAGGGADFFSCLPGSEVLGPEDFGFVGFSAGAGSPGCNPCKEDCSELPPSPNTRSPRLLLHVGDVVPGRDACENGGLKLCTDAVTKGSTIVTPKGPFYFVYLLAHRGYLRTINALTLSIGYDRGRPGDSSDGHGVDIFGWTLCADTQINNGLAPDWPEPGAASTILWRDRDVGQRAETAVAGYFYVGAYTPDALRITPHSVFGESSIYEGNLRRTPLLDRELGSAVFTPGSKAEGCNPCRGDCYAVVPATITSWGSIKALYGRK